MTRRYPLSDLLAATGLSESGLTRRAGISGTTLKNAREMGFTADAADRYAVRCGLHPWEVWPDFGCQPCALEDCDVMFRPHRPGHIFHDKRCARKAWARTERGKASLRAAKERWLETAREYDRKRERERKRRIRQAQREAA